MIELLDPTAEQEAVDRPLAERREGPLRIALLDIRKPRGDVFLDRLAELLAERGTTVRRYAKPTFTKPMPPDLRREITAECDVVIEALAD